LGILWGGVVIFVIGLTQMLRLRLEKNKFEKMLKAIRDEVRVSLRPIANPQEGQPPMRPVETYNQDLLVVGERMQSSSAPKPEPNKKTWGERRQEKKAAKKLAALEREQHKLDERKRKIEGKLPPPTQRPPGYESTRPPQSGYDYYEVTY
jgi:hypothetical protein